MGEDDEDNGTGALKLGQAVRAFYHMNDHPLGYRYVRLLDPNDEVPEAAPIVGLSTGWLPASVAEDYDPETSSDVLVFLHGRFGDAYRQDDPDGGMYWRLRRSLVRPTRAPKPKLSLLVVRWWDYYSANRRSGARSHNVAHEGHLLDALEGPGSPHGTFGQSGEYEVHSAFIRNSDDLDCLGESLATALRGPRRCAYYFLWPTQRPDSEKTRNAPYVDEEKLFALMSRMESSGVATSWPHPLPLYRELASKGWAPRLAADVDLARKLRVLPTVSVEFNDWEADPARAASQAVMELRRLSSEIHDLHTQEPDSYRGVAKLAFSWMGADVKPFTGTAELEQVLRQFFAGARPGTRCLVQHRLEDVACEIRAVCCQDFARGEQEVNIELARMRLHYSRDPNDKTFALTSNTSISASEAVATAFRGDSAALETAEMEAKRLTKDWLSFLGGAQGFGFPAVCRFDFLTTFPRRTDSNGSAPQPEVWVIELSECGASMCGLHFAPRTVAVLNSCLSQGSSDAGTSCSFLPLPAYSPEIIESDPSVASAATPLRARQGQRRGPDVSNRRFAPRPRNAIAVGAPPPRQVAAVRVQSGWRLPAIGGVAVAVVVLLVMRLLRDRRLGAASKVDLLQSFWTQVVRRRINV